MKFKPNCKDCPRLAEFLKDVKKQQPDYFAKPVPPFGDARAHLLVVGLAPGMHGANRTGRPFTGDFAGVLLYETLFKYGFGNLPVSEHAKDKLKLKNCRITNAVKCLPPANKPETSEINQCNAYLKSELESMPENSVIVALGLIAHKSVLKAFGLKQSQFVFSHAGLHELPNGLKLLDSYHCSRYNTQTRRLTEGMFHQVFKKAQDLLAS